MAHITKIKIDGLMGRKEPIELELNRKVNIFFGENGGGKTTLLKILDAAMSHNGDIMQRLPVERAEVHIYSIDRDKTFTQLWERKTKLKKPSRKISEWIEEEEAELISRPAKETNPWKVPGLKGSDLRGWQHTFLPTTRLYVDRRSMRLGRSLTDNELDEIFADNVNTTWLSFYSEIMTNVRTLQESGLRNVVHYALAPKLKQTTGPTHNPSEAYDRVNRFLNRDSASTIALGTKESFLKRYEKEENLRQIVDSLNTLESEIEDAMAPITRFEKTISELFSNKKRLMFEHGNKLAVKLQNGEYLSVSLLSSGEKHLLRMLIDAMKLGPSSLIIDEPELSMHIDWQRKFVNSVNGINPNCQLILASHSPEIMADVDDECIFRI